MDGLPASADVDSFNDTAARLFHVILRVTGDQDKSASDAFAQFRSVRDINCHIPAFMFCRELRDEKDLIRALQSDDIEFFLSEENARRVPVLRNMDYARWNAEIDAKKRKRIWTLIKNLYRYSGLADEVKTEETEAESASERLENIKAAYRDFLAENIAVAFPPDGGSGPIMAEYDATPAPEIVEKLREVLLPRLPQILDHEADVRTLAALMPFVPRFPIGRYWESFETESVNRDAFFWHVTKFLGLLTNIDLSQTEHIVDTCSKYFGPIFGDRSGGESAKPTKKEDFMRLGMQMVNQLEQRGESEQFMRDINEMMGRVDKESIRYMLQALPDDGSGEGSEMTNALREFAPVIDALMSQDQLRDPFEDGGEDEDNAGDEDTGKAE